VTQLVSEIDRVAKQSDFNGTKLLDGSFTSQLFQVGANAGQAIAINNVVDAKASSLGNAKFAAPVNGTDIGTITDLSDVVINGATIGTISGKTTAEFAASAAAQINSKIGEAGVYAEVVTTAGTPDTHSLKLTSVQADRDLVIDGATQLGLADSTAAAPSSVAATATSSFVEDLDVSSYVGAQKALEIVDKALESVNSVRADLGAIQNRFTSVVANLQTSSENLSASRSRIRDTDFAKETAELTRTQILQQAGTAMLAQANQVPQNVLSLLR